MFFFFSISQEDANFLNEIYERDYPMMLSAAMRLVKKETTEDMVHDTILKLVDYLPKLKSLDSSHRNAYITLTVKSVCISYLRKTNKEVYMSFDWMKEIALSPEQIVEQKEAKENIQWMLSALDDRDRLLLIYKFYMEYPNKEIGKLLNIKTKDVSTYIYRAKNRALEVLRKRGDVL